MRRLAVFFVVLLACDAGTRSVSIGDATITREGAAAFGVRIGLSRIGRRELQAVADGPIERRGEEVHIVRGRGLIEWWRGQGAGLEQGVTIASPPSGDGALVLEMSTGSARAEGDRVITLRDDHGAPIATYSALSVIDANGAHVPARMHACDRSIRIEVDDAHAHYPLVVDPTVSALEATLIPTGASHAAGSAFDLSEDETRVIVGDPGTTAGAAGTATIFVRSGTTWTQEAQLTMPAVGNFATWVALSADASLALVAGAAPGSVYVYARVGTSWILGGSIAPAGGVSFGGPLDISGDGTRAFVAGGTSGYVFVIDRAAGTATREAVLPACSGGPFILSTDGAHLACGPSPARIAGRTGTTWAQEIAVLGYRADDLTPSGDFVSVDGSSNVEVYARSGTSWQARPAIVIGAASGAATLSPEASHVFHAGTIYGWSAAAAMYYTEGSYADPAAGVSLGVGIVGAVGVRFAITRTPSSGAGGVDVFRIVRGDAAGCSADVQCMSGHCNDGVCCHTDCGNSTSDCQACTFAGNGMVDGTCAALSPSVAPTVTCRASSGPCDMAAVCMTGNTSCPSNALVTGTVCRPTTSVCDVQETCSGTSAQCPPDVFAPSTVTCRPIAGVCDVAEQCTGTSATCPPDAFDVGTVCANPHDVCERAATCSGTSPNCPIVNPLEPAGTVCHTMSGVCDRTTTCTGTTSGCPDWFVHGVVCRAAAGACDVAESCTGADVNCPPDAVEGAGTVCRASSASCDPAESCDGTGTSCPPDVSTCTTMPDTGAVPDAGSSTSDSGAAHDASGADATTSGNDAATVPAPVAGSCGCRVTATRSGAAWLLFAAAWLARRRARALLSAS